MSTRESTELRRELERLARDLASARTENELLSERYRALLENSSEGVWCLELDNPVAVRLPEDQQVEMILAWGWLAEINQKLAEMFGYQDVSALLGTRLSDLLLVTSDSNLEFVRTFVRSGYKLRDAEWQQASDGTERYFLSTLSGIVENGWLLRVRGTQREVTVEKLARRQQIEASESHRAALSREQEERPEAESARYQEQVSLLTEASSMLMSSLSRTEVLETILSLAQRFVAADGYALWRLEQGVEDCLRGGALE